MRFLSRDIHQARGFDTTTHLVLIFEVFCREKHGNRQEAGIGTAETFIFELNLPPISE